MDYVFRTRSSWSAKASGTSVILPRPPTGAQTSSVLPSIPRISIRWAGKRPSRRWTGASNGPNSMACTSSWIGTPSAISKRNAIPPRCTIPPKRKPSSSGVPSRSAIRTNRRWRCMSSSTNRRSMAPVPAPGRNGKSCRSRSSTPSAPTIPTPCASAPASTGPMTSRRWRKSPSPGRMSPMCPIPTR